MAARGHAPTTGSGSPLLHKPAIEEAASMKHFEKRSFLASAIPVTEAGQTPASAQPMPAALVRMVIAIRNWLRHRAWKRRLRHHTMLMLQLDDHVLKDINISRDEVRRWNRH
ncbi:MAG: hypothetical protein K5872_10475 [Rhizobiaceae bacterium]|nr:hypothetical protein [Rhizobiaceae bacterium]MCV0406641.1 hypothetical protein [Rhizobiaceae bacterium]